MIANVPAETMNKAMLQTGYRQYTLWTHWKLGEGGGDGGGGGGGGEYVVGCARDKVLILWGQGTNVGRGGWSDIGQPSLYQGVPKWSNFFLICLFGIVYPYMCKDNYNDYDIIIIIITRTF